MLRGEGRGLGLVLPAFTHINQDVAARFSIIKEERDAI